MNKEGQNVNNKNSELDSIIAEVRTELRSILIKRRNLIHRLGYTFEKVVANSESICEEIKTTLRDEIVDKTISSRDIERYCLEKWKKKTKPQKNLQKHILSLSHYSILENLSKKDDLLI